MAEVAGLVLGGIPLLISAVEHYEECFRILGCMHEFKHEYRKCRNRVKTIELDYDLTLDKLFLDVVDSKEELERLKTCPDDQAWIDVEARLRERLLPKLHQSYVDTMRDMQETIQDLGEELGVDKALFQERVGQEKGPVPHGHGQTGLGSEWVAKAIGMVRRSQGRMLYEAQRLKFSQGKSRRDDLFDQIERYNRSLDGLMSKNDDVTKILRNSQKSAHIHRGLLEFWRHARNVYSLLLQSWKCPCKAEHCADLRLMHRDTAEVFFDICFRYSHCSVKNLQNPWACHRTVVVEVKKPKQHQMFTDQMSPSASAAQTAEAVPKSGNRLQHTAGKKMATLASAIKGPSNKPGIAHAVMASALSVSFAVAPSSASFSSTSRATATSNTPVTMQEQKQALKPIESLCQAISKHVDKQPCSGVLAGQGVNEEYSLNSPVTTLELPGQPETTTLAALLADAGKTPNRTQRYSIALIIASSHLQLHSSSWLSHRWSGEDVLFTVDKGSAILEQPHLRASFVETSASGPSSPRDETFATLGILLLELCFGTTLENSPFRNKYRAPDGQPDFIMDQVVAQEWAERVEGEAGPEYADAVNWCLGPRRVRPNDNSWRQELWQTVIEPLKSSYQNMVSTGH